MVRVAQIRFKDLKMNQKDYWNKRFKDEELYGRGLHVNPLLWQGINLSNLELNRY